MRKTAAVFIFIFLTGLFAGLFFSSSISEENTGYLSSLLLSSVTENPHGFLRTLIASLVSNLSVAALMLAAVLTRLLCILPPAVLWFKSFAIGFCSGLIYLGDAQNPFILSVTKLLPANLFFVPAFILLAIVCFIYSRDEMAKTKRPSREKKNLQTLVFISLGAIAAGCILQTLVV